MDIPLYQLSFIMVRVGQVTRVMSKEDQLLHPNGRVKISTMVSWKYPEDGWVRLNTDGAAKGNPGEAGAGGIIRGPRGELFEMFAANCGVYSSTKAELLAVMRGLATAWNGGHRSVRLTIDSLVVAQLLEGEISRTSPYFYIIRKCKELLQKPGWRVTIHHCYREANRAADWLANYGVGLNARMVLLSATPADLRDILLEDWSGVGLLRQVPASAA